jgi:competence protein ComEA
MLSKLKTALTLNKSERNGILVLFALLLLIFVIPQIIHSLKKNEKHEYKVFEKEVKQFLADTSVKIEKIDFHNDSYNYSSSEKAKTSLVPFVFDPNKATDADWLKMGFSEKQTRVITNFVNKGGHFYKPEDVAKIYSISEKEFNQIKDYIKIEARPTDEKTMVPPAD